MQIFVSSPLGFAESTTGFRSQIRAVLEQGGHTVVDPWENAGDLEAQLAEAEALAVTSARRARLHEVSMALAARNAETIRGCEAMLAVLDGVDVDSGTASEMGYAFALGGKVICGYRGDLRRAGENDGVVVNLQVQYWIEASGGRIVASLEELRSLDFAAG